MIKKFLVLVAETVALNVAAVLIVWKLLGQTDKFIFVIIAALVIVALLMGLQGVRMFKCYSAKIKSLEEAAEESKKSEQIRKEFVANVSHELKTPLTSISGFIETLQAGASEDPEIRTKFIDIIAIETSRLKRLIEDLLVLSDIENRRDSEWIDFDVKKALENTMEVLSPIAEAKKITWILNSEDNLVINGSVDRFRQMMVNLIENAVKYSNEGGRVWISAMKKDGSIVVSVKDEGIGIAKEHHERLFERFYRVDKSRSKKAGGTGLGLSIVKHIAALFGAKLKVESSIGKGTEFFVIFDADNND